METAEYYFNQGLAFREKGENDKAIELFKKTIEIDSDYVAAYNNLGFIYNATKGET